MNNLVVKYKSFGFIVLTLLFVFMTLVSILTYVSRNVTSSNKIVQFAIQQHLWIMISVIFVSVGFGFFWASMLYKELETKSKVTRSMRDVVFLFLNDDERKIIDFLISSNGQTTQAELARLQGMNKVKVHRAVQKMEEKNILSVEAHGKVRKILMKENLIDALS